MPYIETCLHKNDFQLFPNFSYHGFEQNAGPQNWENFLRKRVHLLLTLNMGIASFLLSKTVSYWIW